MKKVVQLGEPGWLKVPVDAIAKAPWNYKTDDPELKKKLEQNLKRNGQIENLIVREHKGGFEAVNGNHRLELFKESGREYAIVYSLGKITESQAIRIALETNETKFRADTRKLAKSITQLAESFSTADLSGTLPYSEKELARLAELAGVDWTKYENGEIGITTTGKAGAKEIFVTADQMVKIVKMLKAENKSRDGIPVSLRHIEKIEMTSSQKEVLFTTLEKHRKKTGGDGKTLEILCRTLETEVELQSAIHTIHNYLHQGEINKAHEACECAMKV